MRDDRISRDLRVYTTGALCSLIVLVVALASMGVYLKSDAKARASFTVKGCYQWSDGHLSCKGPGRDI